MFSERNYIQGSVNLPGKNEFSIERSIAQYDDFKEECFIAWGKIDLKNIIISEANIARFLYYKDKSYYEKSDLLVSVNPYLKMFSISDKWHPKAIEILKHKFKCERFFPLKDIAMIPSTNNSGIKEIPLTDLESDIISIIKENKITFNQILQRLSQIYHISNKNVIKGLFLNALEQLIAQGPIILLNNKQY